MKQSHRSPGDGPVPGIPFRGEELRTSIQVARGKHPADNVFRNGRIVNVFTNEIYEADLAVFHGRIAGIGRPGPYAGLQELDCRGHYLVPGLIEAHTHIEDALLVPSEFARALAPHGTTTCISDPHEIANVSGIPGLRWMLDMIEDLPLRFLLTLPSCVPASPFESSGAHITARDLAPLANHPSIASIGEVMNYPDVLQGNPELLEIVGLRRAQGNLPIDGHAPELMGHDLFG